jgi:hypothetical protein
MRRKMISKHFLWVVILVSLPVSFLAASTWNYEYLITNETEVDIFFIARPNNTLREKGYIEYIYHYEDGSEYPMEFIAVAWINAEIIHKYVSPTIDWDRLITIMPHWGRDFEFIFIDGYDMMNAAFDEFIVYDGDGNIILTMDDLERGVSFRLYDETIWIGRYTAVLHVTKEMMESGLRKYAGRKYTPKGSDENQVGTQEYQ